MGRGRRLTFVQRASSVSEMPNRNSSRPWSWGREAAQNDRASRQDAGLHRADGTGAGRSRGRGSLPSLRTCSASPQCSAESARCPTHGRPTSRPTFSFSACRASGCGDRMAEVTSFATRSCSSYNMRVRRLPGRKFGLVHGHVVPIPTPDGKVTAISFGGHDPERCEEAKDALTFPAGSAVGRLLHVPRATLHGEVHNTPREAACSLVRRKES
jgi:hypothetical protein